MRTTQQHNQKQCGKCKIIKEITAFARLSKKSKSYKQFKNGIKPWCKECYKEYGNKYMRKLRETSGSKGDHYKNKYGITRDQVTVMLEERNYKCDICNQESDHRYDKLCVDHNHKTGKVRGMLCFSCNVLIGQAKDDPIRLEKSANYLRRNT